jgi:zinc transport system permease protein
VSFLTFDFMRRALIAGALVGLAGPSIGVFVVQRGLSLMGDGIGHVAFMGVAAGLLFGQSPILMALFFAVAGAVAMEVLRRRGKTASDVALALIFYGGIAGGVLLLSFGGLSTISLSQYLFGSVVTVSTNDLWLVTGVAIVTLSFATLFRRRLFAVAYDEEVARVAGLPVDLLNLLVAVGAAFAIAVTAKVVGILLVSSMLVLPVATAQRLASSFRGTFALSLVIGVAVTTGGLVIAFYGDLLPAATIVCSSIGLFVVASGVARLARRP